MYGYDTGGQIRGEDALRWAENLEYYDPVRNVIWTNWRLPKTLPINGTEYIYAYSEDGSTDSGYNISAPNSAFPYSINSEMAYMYYNNLGNIARDGLTNTGPFINLQNALYFSGTPYPPYQNALWTFGFYNGYQQYDFYNDQNNRYAWPVMDGDVMPRVKYELIGREFFPGITIGDTTVAAMFAGIIKNAEGITVGKFNVCTNHQGGPIEQCGATNILVYFKLTMNFFDGRRLVLVMPYGDTAEANWDWDDVACPYGGRECDFYSVENLVPCESDVNPEVSLVADVSNIPLIKRKFGSRGFDEISGGVLNGWLIHTPPIFPAVIGTFVGN